jgi:DNA-binding response OmpR family regulator
MKPSATTLLLAEDESSIREGLKELLELEGFRVIAAEDGAEAWDCWKAEAPQILILDVMMPKVSGFDLCRRIRAEDVKVPILFLTAKAEEIDQIVGFKLGADDYLCKPFSFPILLARVKVLARRLAAESIENEAASPGFAFAGGRVDEARYEFFRAGSGVPLTAREMSLLKVFAAHQDEVLSRDFLLNAVWGLTYYGTTRTLDQHVVQLRKKVEATPSAPRYIQTVHGVGYRYGEDLAKDHV